MTPESTLFYRQNLWLKLGTFILCSGAAMLAILPHLLMQIVLFCLYFTMDYTIYLPLIKGLRKLLSWFAGYWLLGTILGMDFVQMLTFTVRILVFLCCSVYLFGRIKLEIFFGDLRRLRKYSWFQKIVSLLIATMLFGKEFTDQFGLLRDQNRGGNRGIINVVSEVISTCINRASQIEHRTSQLTDIEPLRLERISYANLMGIVFLSMSMLIYAI